MTYVFKNVGFLSLQLYEQLYQPFTNIYIYINRYPDYDFLGDTAISTMAKGGGRYSFNGVIGVMTDVTLLSKCDFFVGTFSSGVRI